MKKENFLSDAFIDGAAKATGGLAAKGVFDYLKGINFFGCLFYTCFDSCKETPDEREAKTSVWIHETNVLQGGKLGSVVGSMNWTAAQTAEWKRRTASDVRYRQQYETNNVEKRADLKF